MWTCMPEMYGYDVPLLILEQKNFSWKEDFLIALSPSKSICSHCCRSAILVMR